MPQNQPKGQTLKKLRGVLSHPSDFSRLANLFVEEAASRIDSSDRFREYFSIAVSALAEETAVEIADVAKSPIEKIFLRSLVLCFLKNDGLGLLMHPTLKDTPTEVSEFRVRLEQFRAFKAWFVKNRPGCDVGAFFDDEVAYGKIGHEERRYYDELVFKYYFVPFDGSYHMTLQPRFPNIGGKPVRADIYFWIPNRPQINVVVECDGFQYHSSKTSFTADRQRDRAFKAMGYEVLRFSGSEIYADPVNTAHELATYLWKRSHSSE